MKSFTGTSLLKKYFLISGLIIITCSYVYALSTSESTGEKNYIFNANLHDEYFLPEIKTIHIEKVRFGLVENVDDTVVAVVVGASSTLLLGEISTTTVYYLGSGEVTSKESLRTGLKIYLFGYLRSDNKSMVVKKIIIANKSKLQRVLVP